MKRVLSQLELSIDNLKDISKYMKEKKTGLITDISFENFIDQHIMILMKSLHWGKVEALTTIKPQKFMVLGNTDPASKTGILIEKRI